MTAGAVLSGSAGEVVPFVLMGLLVAIPVGFTVSVALSFARGGGRDKKLDALGVALGFVRGRHSIQRSYGDPEHTVESIYGMLGGRGFRIHYAMYAARTRALVSVLLPRAETWIETAIAPGLAIGADVTDVIGIRRGLGPAAFGTLPFMNATLQRLFENRRAAASRVIALLDDPAVAELSRGLGPHLLACSDDTLLLVLLDHADEPSVRRACAAAGRVAEALPIARRRLRDTPLDTAVRALAQATTAWVQRTDGEPLRFGVGVDQGTYLTLEIETGVQLLGLGTFAPGPGGPLIHRIDHRPAPIPARFDTETVVDAVRALPPFVTTMSAGSRLKVLIEAQARRDDVLIAAAFGLARALRHAGLKGTSL